MIMRHLRSYRLFILLVVMTASQLTGFSQTLKDVFTNSETPVFFYGVDFTKTKLIDDPATSVTDIRDRQFTGINGFVISEPKKFDLDGAFNRTVEHDPTVVNSRNEKVNAEAIKSYSGADFSRLKASDIDEVIKGFDGGGKKGVGLLFIVEAMSKSAKAMAVWVTMFDPKTRKVLMTERMEGKPGGFGFKMYWSAAIRDVIIDIKKKKYSEWKTKYGS